MFQDAPGDDPQHIRVGEAKLRGIGPALAVALFAGGRGVAELLVASQVILSLALPFAVLPLLWLTADPRRMGALVSPRWMTWLGWASAALILGLNVYLLAAMARG